MENQNIPFRELRKPRKGWSRLKRKSLLMPLRKIDPEGKQNSNQSSIMGQNVSQYLHMLADCHTKENYIKWATNLRSTPQKHSSVAKDGLPPGVSFKKTKCFEIKEDLIKVDDRKKFNTADYIQYFSKTENHHMFNESSLGYVTSLRGYHSSANRDKELFSSIPFKERKNDPTFLKKVHNVLARKACAKLDLSRTTTKKQPWTGTTDTLPIPKTSSETRTTDFCAPSQMAKRRFLSRRWHGKWGCAPIDVILQINTDIYK